MSTPRGFLMLTLSDGRVIRVAHDAIAYYSPNPTGGAWVQPKSVSDEGAILVTETPEQIDALITEAQRAPAGEEG